MDWRSIWDEKDGVACNLHIPGPTRFGVERGPDMDMDAALIYPGYCTIFPSYRRAHLFTPGQKIDNCFSAIYLKI